MMKSLFSSPKCTIERAVPDDLDAVMDAYKQSASQNPAMADILLHPIDLNDRRRFIQDALTDNLYDVFKAVHDGVIEGFFITDKDHRYLNYLYVRQKSCGVGTELMDVFMDQAMFLGVQKIQLTASSTDAAKFYEKFGFTAPYENAHQEWNAKGVFARYRTEYDLNTV